MPRHHSSILVLLLIFYNPYSCPAQKSINYQNILEKGKSYLKSKKVDSAFYLFSTYAKKAPAKFRGEFELEAGKSLCVQKKYLEAIQYFEASRASAANFNDVKIQAFALANLGAVYTSTGNLAQGLDFYKQSLPYFRQLQDTNYLASINLNIAHNYRESALYDLSMDYLFKAIQLFEKTNAQGQLAKAYQTLGNLYRMVDKDSLSLASHYKALEINEKIGDKTSIASSLNDLGNTYKYLFDYKNALEYYERSLSIDDSSFKSTTLGNMAEVYEKMERNETAEKYFLQAVALRSREGDQKALARIFTELGNLYITENKWDKAHKFLSDGLKIAEKKDYKDILLLNLESQQKLNEKTGNIRMAYQFLKDYNQVKEEVFNEKEQQAIQQATIKFKVNDLENQKRALQDENRLEQKNLRMLVIALILFALLFVISFYAYRQNRRFARLEKAKNQEIKHRTKNFLQTLINLFQFQLKEIENPDVKALIRQSQSRVDAMMMIHHSLTENADIFNFTDYAKKLVDYINQSFKNQLDYVTTEWKTDQIILAADQATPLALILNELVNNAYKYAFKNNEDPRLQINMKVENNILTLEVKDNGPGFNEKEMQNKNSEGLKLIEIFVKQLHGKFNLKNSGGTLARAELKIKPAVSNHRLSF